MKKKFVASLPGLNTHSFKLSDANAVLGIGRGTRETSPFAALPLELEEQLLLDLIDPAKTPLVSQETRDAAGILLASRRHK